MIKKSWLARKYCPITLFKNDIEDAKLTSVFDIDEWEQIKAEGLSISDDVYQSLYLYHLNLQRVNYEKIITINTEETFNSFELELLQKEVLNYMHKKQIVIETLPTSNVRIGHHNDYSSYHLWNWLEWENEGCPLPPIVVGTDDTGIFATNILNEFANIYCYLTNSGRTNHNKAFDIIKKLDYNSQVYKFT
ncbi:amidohydrolase family protein [Mucilaginibacter aquatilis]|uniref:hypothetical protein n=1 Tax=Mucilaginibacter aquatilis TaxID=1517760 RepID=UPI0018DC3FBA|nr:hypothetical protein [Mucilaginibacter aquatilis]